MWLEFEQAGMIIPSEEISCVEVYQINDDPRPYRLEIHLVDRGVEESLGLKYSDEKERQEMFSDIAKYVKLAEVDGVWVNVYAVSMIQKYKVTDDPNPYRFEVILKGMPIGSGIESKFETEAERDEVLECVKKKRYE